MIGLTHDPIDVRAVRDAVADPGHGALMVFEGVGRDDFDGREVTELAYEAYPALALPVLNAIVDEVTAQFGGRAAIVHRLGVVPIGEPTVVIAVGTPHRAACYEASRYALEALKERLPVWKKEVYADGSAWKANQSSTERDP